MRQVGRRIRARDTLHAKLHPPIYVTTAVALAAAAAIGVARALRRRAVAAHNAPNLAADERGKRGVSLGLAHLEEDVRVCASEGDGNDLASALGDDAPFARTVCSCLEAQGRGGGVSH